MINIDEVLVSIILTAVILVVTLYYYSAKFESHDIDIQILDADNKFNLVNIESLQEEVLDIKIQIEDTKK
jgi:hypothetical protein